MSRDKAKIRKTRQYPKSPFPLERPSRDARSYRKLKSQNLQLRKTVLDQKRKIHQLAEKKADGLAVLNAINGMVYLCSADHKVEFTNKAFRRRFGHHPVGKSCYAAIYGRKSVCPWCPNVRVFRGQTVCYETQSPKDGRWFNVLSKPFRHWDGSYSKLAFYTDVTQRKIAEEALRESAEKLRLFVEHAPAAIAMLDNNMKYITASRRWFTDYGLKNRNIVGRSHYEVFPEIPERWKRIHRHCLKGAVERNEADPFVRADGHTDWVRWEVRPWKKGDGTIGGLIMFTEIITERKRAHDALVESEEKLRLLFKKSPIGIAMCEMDGTFVEANQAYLDIIGYTHKEAMKLGYWDVTPKKYDRDEARQLRSMEKTGKYGPYEKEYVRKTGERVSVLLSGAVVTGADGVKRIWSLVEDITERKRAEEELKQSLSLQRATLESTADGILVVDRAGKVSDFNKRFLQLWKLPPKKLLSRDDKKLLRSVLCQLKDPKGFLAKVQQLYGHPEKDSFDVLEFKDGRVFERYSHPQRVDGRPVGRVWSFRDVTKRKQTEEALLVSNQRMALHIEQTPLAVIEWDEDFKVREWNPAAEKIFGYSRKEALGKYYDFIVPESARPQVDIVGKKLMAQRGGQRSANGNITKNGKAIVCEWFNTTLVDPTGKTIGVASLVEDVTARTQAEEQVRRTQLGYQQLVENAKDGIFTVDTEGRFLLANPEIRRMLGYTREEFLHLNILDSYPEDFRAEGEWRLEHLRQGKTMRYDRFMKRKNGSSILVEVIAWKTSDGYVQAFVRDITDRKRAEDAVRESRRQLLQIIDTVPHMIFAKDKESRFLLVNRALAEAYQQKPEDLIGVRWQDIHKDRQESERSLEVDREVLTTGKPKVVSGEIFTDVQGRKHVLQTIKIPFNMVGVKETCILGVSVDVTEQKKVEEFRNDIVRTVSHELRTPLSIEKEGISLLLDGVAGAVSPKQKEILETVMRSINRLSRMITSLLDISSLETGKTKLRLGETSLDDLVRDVVFEFKKRAEEKRIELKVKLPEARAQVFADADKITQVLSNLVDNAIKFTPEKGLAEISIAVLKNEVECTVEDTGIGISKENIPKIFEKFRQFSRTVGPGEKGFGLGLSIVKGIIDMHGGRIWAKSGLGKGTRVTFTLPLRGSGALMDFSKVAEPRRKTGGLLDPEKGA